VRAGLSVTVATFYGCPMVQLTVFGTSAEPATCNAFRSQSLASLLRTKPNLVVIAARDDAYIQAGNISLAPPHGRATEDPANKARLWQIGLTAVMSTLNRAGIPVIVVTPPPRILAQP